MPEYDTERYLIEEVGSAFLLLDLKNNREPWCPYSAYVGMYDKKFFAELRAKSGRPAPLCGCEPYNADGHDEGADDAARKTRDAIRCGKMKGRSVDRQARRRI